MGSFAVDTARTIHPESEMALEIRECKECGDWWIHPLPRQEYLNSLYRNRSRYVIPSNYKPLNDNAIRQAQSLSSRDYRRAQNQFGGRKKGTKCLEIGVGAGAFHYFLKSQGYDCHGIDPGNWNPSIQLFDAIESLPYCDYEMFFYSTYWNICRIQKNFSRDLEEVLKWEKKSIADFRTKIPFRQD